MTTTPAAGRAGEDQMDQDGVASPPPYQDESGLPADNGSGGNMIKRQASGLTARSVICTTKDGSQFIGTVAASYVPTATEQAHVFSPNSPGGWRSVVPRKKKKQGEPVDRPTIESTRDDELIKCSFLLQRATVRSLARLSHNSNRVYDWLAVPWKDISGLRPLPDEALSSSAIPPPPSEAPPPTNNSERGLIKVPFRSVVDNPHPNQHHLPQQMGQRSNNNNNNNNNSNNSNGSNNKLSTAADRCWAFQTDQEISRRQQGHGSGNVRELERWHGGEVAAPTSADTGALEWPSAEIEGSKTTWDQFAVNEKTFGVTSTYVEGMYSTQLNEGDIPVEVRRKADKLVEEMGARGGASGPGPGGRWGHCDDDGVDDEEMDEETRFSAVVTSNPKAVPKTFAKLDRSKPSTGSFASSTYSRSKPPPAGGNLNYNTTSATNGNTTATNSSNTSHQNSNPRRGSQSRPQPLTGTVIAKNRTMQAQLPGPLQTPPSPSRPPTHQGPSTTNQPSHSDEKRLFKDNINALNLEPAKKNKILHLQFRPPHPHLGRALNPSAQVPHQAKGIAFPPNKLKQKEEFLAAAKEIERKMAKKGWDNGASTPTSGSNNAQHGQQSPNRLLADKDRRAMEDTTKQAADINLHLPALQQDIRGNNPPVNPTVEQSTKPQLAYQESNANLPAPQQDSRPAPRCYPFQFNPHANSFTPNVDIPGTDSARKSKAENQNQNQNRLPEQEVVRSPQPPSPTVPGANGGWFVQSNRASAPQSTAGGGRNSIEAFMDVMEDARRAASQPHLNLCQISPEWPGRLPFSYVDVLETGFPGASGPFFPMGANGISAHAPSAAAGPKLPGAPPQFVMPPARPPPGSSDPNVLNFYQQWAFQQAAFQAANQWRYFYFTAAMPPAPWPQGGGGDMPNQAPPPYNAGLHVPTAEATSSENTNN